ncbi:MAG: T9SS type A sorting domain-containing protein [Bacteroidetes bacterium]|nr:T9SS type A sorting domain-containing protein [Bacteroidota bacterium]
MKYIYKILFMVLILAQYDASAQTDIIVDAEWFFDTDTAVAKNGTLGINTPSDSLSLNYSYISVPSSLSYGVHYIYIRTKSDTGNAWSQYEGKQFYIQPTIDYAEYFIDTDPGVGNGTQFNFNSISDSISDSLLNISTTGLSSGRHYLYIRTHSVNGAWSQLQQSQEFNITNRVVSMEYFYDNDPGAGNGTHINFTTASNSAIESINSLSTSGLGYGNHTIHIRTLDADGHWSHYQSTNFFITAALVSGEYFFDTDPGIGQGISFTFSTSDSISENISASANGLAPGEHILSIRTQSNSGAWGFIESTKFYINPRIVQYKYWIDTIPEFAIGTLVDLPQSQWSDSINISPTISLACIDTGLHYIYIVTKDELNHWSLPQQDSFNVIPGNNINLTHTIPGPGPNGTPLRLYGIGGSGANYRYRDVTHGGAFGVNNLFVIPNDSVVIFQVKDTCGNYAYDTITAPSTPTDLSTGGGIYKTVLNAYNEWIYICDSNQKIIIAIKDNSQNLDTFTVEYVVNQGAVRKEVTNHFFYLNRNWRLHAKNAPTDSVDVKLYWTNTEFDSLNVNDASIDSIEQCQLTKYSGPNQNLSLDDNTYGGTNATLIHPTYGYYNGDNTAGRFAQFKVKGFSEFYIGNGQDVPLPLELLSLEVQKQNNDAQILWQANNESFTSHYIVERSFDTKAWTPIDQKQAKNEFINDYGTVDVDVLKMHQEIIIYYRIKQIKENGEYIYSDVKQIYNKANFKNALQLWPNPAIDKLYISYAWPTESNVSIQLMDITGKIILSTIQVMNKNNTMIEINVSQLAKGIYTLMSTDYISGKVQFSRFEKL